jgi:hypothetical protein
MLSRGLHFASESTPGILTSIGGFGPGESEEPCIRGDDHGRPEARQCLGLYAVRLGGGTMSAVTFRA